jgi:hypothetical protein
VLVGGEGWFWFLLLAYYASLLEIHSFQLVGLINWPESNFLVIKIQALTILNFDCSRFQKAWSLFVLWPYFSFFKL